MFEAGFGDEGVDEGVDEFSVLVVEFVEWSCPGLTDTVCKGRGTLEVSVDHAFIEEAGAVGEEATATAAEAATS